MRLWKKIVLGFIGLIVCIVAAGYVYLFPMGGLEKNVNAKLNALLAENTGFQVTIGAIKGDVVNQLVLENVVATYHDSMTQFQTVSAKRLTASYSLSNLWHRNLRFSLVQIDSLVLHVKKDTLGRFLPQFATSKGGGTSASQPPSFFIGTFLVNDAAIAYDTPHDTVGVSHLSFEASFLIDEGTYSLDIKRLQVVGDKPQVIVKEAGGKLTFNGADLYFENLHVLADGTRLNLTGLVDVKRQLGSIEMSAENVNLGDIKKFGGPELNGVVNVDGNLRRDTVGVWGNVDIDGTFLVAKLNQVHTSFRLLDKVLYLDTIRGVWFDSSTIKGQAQIDFGATPEKYTLQAGVQHFNLKRLVPTSFSSDLNGSLSLDGSSFRDRDLSLLITTSLSDSRFDVYPIQEAHGQIQVTTDSIRFLDQFSVRYFEDWLSATGKVEYSGLMDLQVVGELPRLDRYRDKFFIKEPSGRCHTQLSIIGQTSDPAVRGTFTSDSLWLYSLYTTGLTADLDIDHFFTSPKGEVHCRFAKGTAWDVSYDSLRSDMSIDSGHVYIDSIFSENQYASVSGRGDLQYDVYPSHLRLDTLRLTLFSQRFFNTGKLTADIDSSGFDFTRVQISDGRGRLEVGGRFNYDETLRASVTLQNAQVSPWMHLFRGDWPVTAAASCRVNLSGDLDHPAFDGIGSLDSLVYKDLRLGDVTFGVRYADRKMTVDSLLVKSHPGLYRAEGSFYVDLALTQRAVERLPKLPMALKISMSDTQFNLVYLFLPSVEELDGEFYSGFDLTGTPSDPHLNGQAWLKNGRLKYYDLADTLYTDSAGVSMTDNQIVLDRIEAYVHDRRNRNRRSLVILDGGLVVKSLDSLYYDVDVSLPKEFPFRYELDDISGVAEGDMHVEGYNAPEVTGDLRLISMRYAAEFAKATEGSPLMEAMTSENSWDLNLNIDIPSNYWIKNKDVDAEFSGAVNLVRDKGSYRFAGDMTFLRGKGYLFEKTFRIDAGSTVSFADIEYLNPTLDITATARIPGQRRETDSIREDIDLCVHVTGTLETPQIDPCEGSQFTQQDILPLIVANYYSSDTAQASGQFGQRAIDYLSSAVSQIGTKGLHELGQKIGIGVETFEIDPTYGGELDPLKSRFTVGFYTVPNLYVYGRSAFTGQKGQEVGFEYRINKTIYVEGKRDEAELYQLNLQLHWEM